MKTQRIYYLLSLMMVLVMAIQFSTNYSPKNKKKKNAEAIDMKKDIDVAGKSVVKNSKKAVAAKVALHFKTISVQAVTAGKGQNTSTARAYAILKGISDETRQSIANEFYNSLKTKLQTTGIPCIEYANITTAPSFIKMKEKEIDKYLEGKNFGYIDVVTANNAPYDKQIVGNPGIWKAYAKVGKEVEANLVTIDVVIDFARFEMEINSHTGRSYKSTKASANVIPEILILTMNGATGYSMVRSGFAMIGKYGEATTININKNLNFPGDYSSSVDSYSGEVPANMKKKISFGTNITTGSFIVQANQESYKAQVLSALDKYSDYIILKIKEIRK